MLQQLNPVILVSPQSKSPCHLFFHHSSLTDSSVTIFSNPKTKNLQHQSLGVFYRMEKSYFYKQQILVYYMLNFLLDKTNQKEKQTRNQYQKICARFIQVLGEFKKTYNPKVKDFNRLQVDEHLYASLWEAEKSNLETVLRKIQTYKTNGDANFNQTEIELLLDLLLQKQIQRTQLKCDRVYSDYQQIFGKTITIEQVTREQKIVQLTIVQQKLTSKSPKQLKQSHLLYKTFIIKSGSSTILTIIQTNQQKSIFFKISYPPSQNCTPEKISQLFNFQQKQSLLQSQGSISQSSHNSQIVQDEQFYRLSSKISISCRKNSFNSGQKIIVTGEGSTGNRDQRDFLSYNKLYASTNNGGISEIKIRNNPISVSKIYTRSSSLEKGNFMSRDNLYTSIDLLMRLEVGQNGLNGKRKKSCQNPRDCRKSSMLQKKQGDDIFWKQPLKINLFNQKKATLYSQRFYHNYAEKARHPLSQNMKYPFLQLSQQLSQQLPHDQQSKTSPTQSRLNVIRTFFRHSNNQIN